MKNLKGELYGVSNIYGDLTESSNIYGDLTESSKINGSITYGMGTGRLINDYEELINKPQINSVELIGDKTFEELGMSAMTNFDIDNLIN